MDNPDAEDESPQNHTSAAASASCRLRGRVAAFRERLERTLECFGENNDTVVSNILSVVAESLATTDEPDALLLRRVELSQPCAVAVAELLTSTQEVVRAKNKRSPVSR